MHDQVLGTTQSVLSLSLEPGESVVAETAEFAWMTDSIQMAPRPAGLATYTAKVSAGTIAFASRVPGSIVCLEITRDRDYLVHHGGLLAATTGIEVTRGFELPLHGSDATVGVFVLRRISGSGRVWVCLSGDAVRRDLSAGTSLRTHPWHIGICAASVAVQMAELPQVASDTFHFALLSGPGSVWLQSNAAAGRPGCEGGSRDAAGELSYREIEGLRT